MKARAYLVSAWMLLFVGSCTTVPVVELAPQLSTGQCQAPKTLDVSVQHFRFAGVSAEYARLRLFDELSKRGYRVHCIYNDEEALRRGASTLISLDLGPCDVRSAMHAILGAARLGFTVEKEGFIIDCEEVFRRSSIPRETWAGTIEIVHLPLKSGTRVGATVNK